MTKFNPDAPPRPSAVVEFFEGPKGPAGAAGAAGAPGVTSGIYRGAWVTGTAYKANDMVTSGGQTYAATNDHTAGATFAGDLSAHWLSLVGSASLPTVDLREYGAKFDGSTDDKAAVDAAIAQAVTDGGARLIGPARKATTLVTTGGHALQPGVYLELAGRRVSTVKHIGNNVCFAYSDGGVSPDGTKAGGAKGFRLLGNNGASAVGLKLADHFGGGFEDIIVGSRTVGEQYSAGVGILLRTESFWCEGSILRNVGSLFNATGIRLERTQVAGGQTAAQNSFAYTNLHDCWVNIPDAGTGLDFGGPADNYILPYMGQFDVHLWLGVAGAPVSNAIGVLIRANAEVPPNTLSSIRIEPKGSGTGNFTIKNLGGKFNARGGITRWNDASASESRAAAGSTLMHGASPALGLDPSAAVPAVVAFDDLWAGKHAGFGVTAKANQEASYTFGYSGAAGAPIHRFTGMGGAQDPTAPFDVDTNTKAWVDTTGAFCIGTVADPRKISRGSANPEGSVTGTRGDIYIRTINTGASLYTKAQGDATNTGWVCISALKGTKVFDWGSVAAEVLGAGDTLQTTVTVVGAAMGDFALAAMDVVLSQGLVLTATVTAVDTVTVTLLNGTAAPVDLASGNLNVRVQKN